jgi:hypothetical protein
MKRRKAQPKFVLCIRNDGCDDLEPRKVYQVLEVASAVREEYFRVVDESGEDYLYPAEYFVPIELPSVTAKALAASPNKAKVSQRSALARHR